MLLPPNTNNKCSTNKCCRKWNSNNTCCCCNSNNCYNSSNNSNNNKHWRMRSNNVFWSTKRTGFCCSGRKRNVFCKKTWVYRLNMR